jgi:peptidoglycan/LPS O-acetylase OafA/YrhL
VSRGRIPELDGIRGIAISMVVLYHDIVYPIRAPFKSLLAYALAAGRLSWTGVDLFFVLSGFLIGGILLDSRDSPNYFRDFYRHRFFRIIPLYLAVLLITSGVMKILGGRFSLNPDLPIYPYFLFAQNFLMSGRNIDVTWSLAIEEQFYLTLPMVIRFAPPRLLTALIILGAIAAPISRVALFFLFPGHPWTAFFMMPCRADALLLGVLGAIIVRNERWKANIGPYLPTALMVFITGAGVLTVYYRIQSQFLVLSIGLTWIAGLYFCLILYAVTKPQSRLSSCLRWRWLMGLGSIAYGIYLIHGQINGAVASLRWPLLPSAAVAVFFTICVATFSWRYYEKPFIDFGHNRDSSTKAAINSHNPKRVV